jgi:KaiC/GvpD/RAD55 family RecA-like ATPase
MMSWAAACPQMIMGRPGTGKTMLAQQYTFRNGRSQRPAVYFSTVSEPLEKIARFGQSLTFFDTAAIGTSVVYEDLGVTVHRPASAALPSNSAARSENAAPG